MSPYHARSIDSWSKHSTQSGKSLSRPARIAVAASFRYAAAAGLKSRPWINRMLRFCCSFSVIFSDELLVLVFAGITARQHRQEWTGERLAILQFPDDERGNHKRKRNNRRNTHGTNSGAETNADRHEDIHCVRRLV